MKNLGSFIDDVYESSYIDHRRPTGRAIVMNDWGEVLLEKICRDDIFGNAEYYETPGGGLNPGETSSAAAVRETEEECGLKIEILEPIGAVEDEYNLIHRHNVSEYYLARLVGEVPAHREEYETRWIKEISFLPIDEAIEAMSHPKNDIARIVYRREKIILEKAKEMFYEYRDSFTGMR